MPKELFIGEDYRVVEIFDPSDCFYVQTRAGLLGNTWKTVHIVRGDDPEQANTQARVWQEIKDHEDSCPYRVGWFSKSRVPVKRRREIDRWYNTLTDDWRDRGRFH